MNDRGAPIATRDDASSTDAAAPWTRLWKAGVLHSCAEGISGNYDGAIGDFWRARFSTLQDAARVVDIGTGNGPLAVLCRSFGLERGLRFEIHGVDAADITPAEDVPDCDFSGITFHPKTLAGSLPFADSSVDLLVSQYGFEYAPREAALAEACRVIGRRGRIALIVHSTDSLVYQVSGQQLDAARFALDESPIWDDTAALIGVLASAPTAAQRERLGLDPRAESVRNAFNASASWLLATARSRGNPQFLLSTIRHVQNVLVALDRSGAAEAKALLDAAFQSLTDERWRLQQMRRAALDPEALAELGRAFGSAGNPVTLAPIDQGAQARMGWGLVSRDG